jgi:hypothetical protein
MVYIYRNNWVTFSTEQTLSNQQRDRLKVKNKTYFQKYFSRTVERKHEFWGTRGGGVSAIWILIPEKPGL